MRNIKSVLLVVLMLAAANAAFAQTRIGGRVVEIVDAKTIVIQTSNNGRLTAVLQYIEVPEAAQPFHQIAVEHLRALVFDKAVEFRARGLSQSKTVGQLLLNGVDVSRQMIRDGAAWYAVLEKNAQDTAESAVYESNEAQAKSEKRGVWSMENLKPSWEFRAEVEENRRRQERAARESSAKTPVVVEEIAPPKPPVKRQMNSESKLLASADAAIKLPANMKSVGGLLIGYEPSKKLGVVATPLLRAEFADKNGEQTLAVQIAYLYYDANESKGRQSVYIVGVDSESADYKFLKYNDLVLTADNQKILIGKPKRVARQTASGVKESLLYEIKKNVFTKIAGARNLQIKVGTYSKSTNSEIQKMLYNLLQTSL